MHQVVVVEWCRRDWNPATYAEANDASKPGPFIYAASKKLAEKAAWDFSKEHPEMQITTWYASNEGAR